MYFNAFTTKEINCYDCTVNYEATYADSHNAMDLYAGKFTAPVNGHYLLQFHAAADHGHEVQAIMKVDGTDVAGINDWAAAVKNKRVTGISTSVMQFLKAGDQVWVQLHRGKLKGHGAGSQVYTSFLGHLVGTQKNNEI